MPRIEQKDVEKAQDKWADAIVEIGRKYTTGGDVVGCAEDHIKKLYGYDGKVLFKPTKCRERQFRPTAKGALSYFVGNDLVPAGFNEDKGFAIAPYIGVRFENAEIIEGSRAIAMGNYFFTPAGGCAIKVEYTFGYRRRKDGDIVIDVHHSSLPYDPD